MSTTKTKEFKKQARNFHIVVNKKSLPHLGELIMYLKTEKCRYLLCRKGLNKRGEEHAHIYVNFCSPRLLCSKNTFGAHIAKCRGSPKENVAYIESHHPDLVEEFGSLPKGKADISCSWDEFTEDLKQGKVDKFSFQYARHEQYANRRIAECRKKTLSIYNGDLRHKNCWIWGERGTGKSLAARFCDIHKIFPKKNTKWWDGYEGEKVVVQDDLDPDRAKMLADNIKTWSDRYPFFVEIKNGAACMDPRFNYIITSQYTIDESFNEEDAKAIKRRFTVLHFMDDGSIVDETDWSR